MEKLMHAHDQFRDAWVEFGTRFYREDNPERCAATFEDMKDAFEAWLAAWRGEHQ